MKKGNVYINNLLAGQIIQTENEYIFKYDEDYLSLENKESVSLTLPIRKEPYISKTLFPFFDGLIPEGYLLEIANKIYGIDPTNRMELLLTICKDVTGNVSIERIDENE